MRDFFTNNIGSICISAVGTIIGSIVGAIIAWQVADKARKQQQDSFIAIFREIRQVLAEVKKKPVFSWLVYNKKGEPIKVAFGESEEVKCKPDKDNELG